MAHIPVMVEEALEGLAVRAGGFYVDGTGGGGGHAEALLERAGPTGRVLVLDRDPDAVDRLRYRLARFGNRVEVRQENYVRMAEAVRAVGSIPVDGILLDLGISSYQVDDAGRGFSLSRSGPLDMRMDPASRPSAQDIVATWSDQELADVIWRYGEERDSRRIARAIVRARDRNPIATTAQLAELVAETKGGRRGRIHPATKTFQALRIAVNGELEDLPSALEGAWGLLAEGGRLAVISFHSLEDREVKRFMRRHVGRWESLQAGGRRWEGDQPAAHWVVRSPRRPTPRELEENPRSRSARLRVIERMGDDHGD